VAGVDEARRLSGASNFAVFDDAWRCIGEAATAIKTRKETRCEAEVNRTAGEIALGSRAGNLLKAQAYFERAVARQRRAKSWELRAATKMARLWRNQRKREPARELLAPANDWFTEGFDTLYLKEAKALLVTLHELPDGDHVKCGTRGKQGRASTGSRFALSDDDDLGSYWRAVIEVGDVVIGQTNAPGGNALTNGPRLVGAMDPVERIPVALPQI
jgi:hypothetical protein